MSKQGVTRNIFDQLRRLWKVTDMHNERLCVLEAKPEIKVELQPIEVAKPAPVASKPTSDHDYCAVEGVGLGELLRAADDN